jgi:hypothetical protein
MSPKNPGQRRRGVIPLLALLVASPVVTLTAQSATNVIFACVGDNSRQVRFVGAEEPCRNNETRVTFNVTGPQGPEGPQGPPGPAGPQGPSGVTGQDSTTVFGTGSIASTMAFQVVPGLAQVVNVPENSRIYVSTTGGVSVNSAVPNQSSVADIEVFVDNMVVSDRAARRVTATNVSVPGAPPAGITGVANWSISQTLELTPGEHTLEVRVVRPFGPISATVSSGDASSPLQGDLTVTILKK